MEQSVLMLWLPTDRRRPAKSILWPGLSAQLFSVHEAAQLLLQRRTCCCMSLALQSPSLSDSPPPDTHIPSCFSFLPLTPNLSS